MSRFGWWMVDRASRLLEPEDREAALGDVVEAGQSAPQALRDIVGMAVRRQAAWSKERLPWFAMLALIATLLSRVLLQLDLSFQMQLRTWWRYGVHQDTGMTLAQDLLVAAILLLAVFAWVCTSGFVLAYLSGRTVWLTGPVFYLFVLNWPLIVGVLYGRWSPHAARFSGILMQALLPFTVERGWCLVAGILGVRLGLRRRRLEARRAWLVVATVVLLTLLATWSGGWIQAARLTWSEGLWRGQVVPWYSRLAPFAILCWPAFYMAWTARRGDRPIAS